MFFFSSRRRHTRWTGDWSSDVCSSDLKLRQNQFGFVANGPVYIPKLFDGRNTTFWMANYEGWRVSNGTNLFSTVPTTADLQRSEERRVGKECRAEGALWQ